MHMSAYLLNGHTCIPVSNTARAQMPLQEFYCEDDEVADELP